MPSMQSEANTAAEKVPSAAEGGLSVVRRKATFGNGIRVSARGESISATAARGERRTKAALRQRGCFVKTKHAEK